MVGAITPYRGLAHSPAVLARAVHHGNNTSSQGRKDLLAGWRQLTTASDIAGKQQKQNDAASLQKPRRHANARLVDRDFFHDVLNVSATRRDTKQYLSRFTKDAAGSRPSADTNHHHPSSGPRSTTGVNLGQLYGVPAAVQQVPLFKPSNSSPEAEKSIEPELHVALVSIRTLDLIEDDNLNQIALTLSQLVRLDLRIIIAFDVSSSIQGSSSTTQAYKMQLERQADRLTKFLDRHNKAGSSYLESMLETSPDNDMGVHKSLLRIAQDRPLLRAVRRGSIPVIAPIAYNSTVRAVPVGRSEVMLALAVALSGLISVQDPSIETQSMEKMALERIIMIDPLGGIPSQQRADGAHVFVNVEQEYNDIMHEIATLPNMNQRAADIHSENLRVLKECLALLPPSASALVISPQEAASSSGSPEPDPAAGNIRTRRQKNSLIYNLLTNRPVISSSLPLARLSNSSKPNASFWQPSRATMVKRGIPLMIRPDPRREPWKAPQKGTTDMSLHNNPDINLPRLLALIEDSFKRRLDVKHYLDRIQDRIAGIIIAGEYEGGAILTWETPPDSDDDPKRLVPYLDKFAVLQKSQGNAGAADIVFQAMVGSCFPHGVCWRSRADNPVNKWYFERSAGSWKLPGGQWTMFWTLPGEDLILDAQRWRDYVAVCQGVTPSWADGKRPD